jgi:hypothetical protein
MLEVLRGTAARAMSVVQARYSGSTDFIDLWLADLAPVFGEDALFEPKAWLEIMGIVVNDDGLMETYRKEFADPNYAIMKNAALESVPGCGEARDAAAEAVASFALLIKAGLFITSLLGRNPGQERAVELAARLLRQYLQSISTPHHAPAQTVGLAASE